MFARAEARKRRHTHAVTTVQAAVRMWLARRQYLHTRRAIVTIQSGYRGQRDRLYTKNIRCGTRSVPSPRQGETGRGAWPCACRAPRSSGRGCGRGVAYAADDRWQGDGWALRQAGRVGRRREHRAALAIQSAWRGHVAQRKYQHTRKSIIMTQNAWRCRMAKRKLRCGRFLRSVPSGCAARAADSCASASCAGASCALQRPQSLQQRVRWADGSVPGLPDCCWASPRAVEREG